ncbi:DUF4153 domain-containing protein [Candidatus Gracilibacteria bacterium]|nr:DUF4153 domain-containing protein [Candidatus Gracilibacteria bacterium]
MIKIFSFLSSLSIKDMLKKYIISFLIIIFTTIINFLILRGDFNDEIINTLTKISSSLIITFFASVGFYLLKYNKINCKVKNNHIPQIFPILFGIFFYFTFDLDINSGDNFMYFILTLIGFISFLFISPFLRDILSYKDLKIQYDLQFRHTLYLIISSSIIGGLFYLLCIIGVFAVFTLFDLKDYEYYKIYGDLAIIVFSLFTPSYFLLQIGQNNGIYDEKLKTSKLYDFLIKFIGVPFIYIYFFILYAYTLKVFLNFQDWPKGEVSWLVIVFSSFGYLLYILSKYLEDNFKLIKNFRKYFPFVVAPQLFMLFYAIFLRIGQYDLTTNRYFVVVFGIWLLIVSLYLIISKKKNLYIITSFLTLFIIIISAGPWGVYKMPLNRQLNRLEKNLIQAHILNNGKIKPLSKYEDIDIELSREIYNGIEYTCNFNDCGEIKTIFKDLYDQYLIKYKKDFIKNNKISLNSKEIIPPKWGFITFLGDTLKVRSYEPISPEESGFLYITLIGSDDFFPLDLKNYTKIYKIGNYDDKGIKIDKKILKIMSGSELVDEINLEEVLTKIDKTYKDTKNTEFEKDNLTFDVSGKNGKYLLLLENISFDFENENMNLNINGYLLKK